MFSALASITPLQARGLGQMVELYLARLYHYLLGLETSPQSHVPSDLTQHVAKADALVHAYIRMRTSMRLKHAGYAFHARAMRTPIETRRSDQGVAGSDIYSCSREPAARIKQAQDCTPETPAELLARLEAVISNFQRAEHIAGVLARIIVCALAHIFSDVGRSAHPATVSQAKRREINVKRRVGLGPPNTVPEMGRGPPNQWPPTAMNLPAFVGRRCTANEFAEIPPT